MNVSATGGTVKVNDAPISDSGYYSFADIAKVKLEAVPAQGYRFVRWSGNNFSSIENPVTIDINCDKNIQAEFNPITPVLTLEKHGRGTITPSEGQYSYLPGTVINLQAVPDKGWQFARWSPNVDSPASMETSLTINADMRVTADFSRVWSVWMIFAMIAALLVLTLGITWLAIKYGKKLMSAFPAILRSSYTALVFRLISGGIFIFTGIAKVQNIPALVAEIDQYRILPAALTSLYGNVLPFLEIAVGVLLVLGILPRIIAGLAGLLLISFAAAKIIALIMNLNITICYCFGPARPLLSTQSLAIDFIMLLMTAQIIWSGNKVLSVPASLLWRKRKKTE